MKTIRFFERRSTWVGLLLTLPVAPLIAFGFPRLNIVEGFHKNARAAAQYNRPPASSEADKQFKSLLSTGSVGGQTKLQQLSLLDLTSSDLFYLKPFQQLAHHAEQEFGEWLEKFAAWENKIQVSVQIALDKEVVKDLGAAQRLAWQFASAALAAGETTRSLHFAEIAAKAYDPLPAPFHLAGRVRAFQFCEDLLRKSRDLPLDDIQATLDRLSLADENSHGWYATYFDPDTIYSKEDPWGNFLLDPIAARRFLAAGAWYLALDSVHFRRPENRRWAEQLKMAGQGIIRYPVSQGMTAYLPWTQIQSLAAQFGHVVRTESNLLPDRMKLNKLMDGVDREMVALYAYGFLREERSKGQLYTYVQSNETYRYALKAAFAARQYRSDNGSWPSIIEELVPKYISWLPPDSSKSATPDIAQQLLTPGKFPFGPLRIEQTTVTKHNAARLLGLVPAVTDYYKESSPWRITFNIPDGQQLTPGRLQGQVSIARQEVNNLRPLDMYALAERLKSMSVFKNVRVSPEGTAGTDNLWRGFQKAFTRELHLRALLLNAGVTIPNVPPMNAIASTTPEPFQVEADLDMPDLVFTITSYGADGRPFPQEPQLHLRHTTVTGEPTGDLIVCAESF